MEFVIVLENQIKLEFRSIFLPIHQISTSYRHFKSFEARSKAFIYDTGLNWSPVYSVLQNKAARHNGITVLIVNWNFEQCEKAANLIM